MMPGACVEVWLVPLLPGDAAEERESVLSDEEERRSARFLDSAARFAYRRTRTALRELLGARLNLPPTAVPIVLGESGKPFLAGKPPDDRLEFNLTHTQGLAVIAVVRGRRVGVDAERVRDLPDLESVARSIMTPGEWRQWNELPVQAEPMHRGVGVEWPERLRAFYTLWTCKESLLKAAGVGLALEPSRIHVGLDCSKQGELRTRLGGSEPDGWHWTQLPLPAGHLGAVACEGDRLPVHIAGYIPPPVGREALPSDA